MNAVVPDNVVFFEGMLHSTNEKGMAYLGEADHVHNQVTLWMPSHSLGEFLAFLTQYSDIFRSAVALLMRRSIR
jgi:hypothetical protein